ncbi:hypothetical protein G7Y79_00077g099600 [Physcia stellaris]|nr:hypothetical protein G7Y79_00077g099600 [Physcia stellaris]
MDLPTHHISTPIRNQSQPQRNRLDTLPPEIVRTIAGYTSPPDKACLALCNHFLFAILGPRVFSVLQPGTKEEEGDLDKFLTTLTRDIPTHFYCHQCSRLHPQDRVGPPGPALQPRNRLLCVASSPDLQLYSRLKAHPPDGVHHYLLTFPHVQLAMKRYRHGPLHGISTNSLAYVEVHVSDREQGAEQLTTLLSVEAQIRPEPASLHLRVQQWATVKSRHLPRLLSAIEFARICDHLINLNGDITRLIEKVWTSHGTEVRSDRPATSAILQCRECMLDYQVQLKMLGDEGLALVITKWLDLGAGLTPTDIKWHYFRVDDRRRAIPATPGAARRRFEGEPGLSQDELSARNAGYLIDKRYMKVMDRWGDKTWILQGGQRLPFIEHLKRRSDLVLLVFAVCFLLPLHFWIQVRFLS